MATYYIDYNGGNDSNDGLSFANRRKTLPARISREDTTQYNDLVGDEFRIMGMPATNMGINATWVVGQPNRRDENGTTDNNDFHINNATAASPIEITVSADHNYSTGDLVAIRNVYGVLAANGTWVITVTGARTFTLNNSSGVGTYASGSSADYAVKIPGRGLKFDTGVKHIWSVNSYNNNTNAQSSTAAYQRPDGSSVYGISSTNVTTDFRGGWGWGGVHATHRISVAAGFTTGKAWYYKLDATLDLSSYQQISMMFCNRATDANNNTSHIRLALCTDDTGDTIAHNVEIPGFARRGMFPVVKDFGANLNSAIKSIAIYIDSDTGTHDIRMTNIVACPASSNASTMTHQHIVGKNTAAEPVWWQPQYLWEDHIIFGQPTGVDFDYHNYINQGNSMSVYGHTSETVPLYKILPYYTHKINTGLTQADINKFRFYVRFRDTATANPAGTFEASPTTSITGGWNTTDMSSQDSITWIYVGDRSNQFLGGADDNQSNLHFSHFGLLGCSTTSLYHMRGNNVTIGTLHQGNQASGIFYVSSTRDGNVVFDKFYICQSGFSGIGGGSSRFDPMYQKLLHLKDVRHFGCGSNTFGNINYSGEGIMIDHMETYGNRFIFQNQYRQSSPEMVQVKNLIAKNIESTLGSNPIPAKFYNSTISFVQQERYEWANTHRGHGGSMTAFENYNGTSGDSRIFFDWGDIKTETSVRHGTAGTAWAFRPTMVFGSTYSRGQLYANTTRLPLYLQIAEFYAVANKEVTCKAFMRRTDTGLSMRLKVNFRKSYPHVSQDHVANMSANADTWQEVTLTFTPISSGIIYINAEAFGGNSYTGYVDSISLTQAP
tara:strand:+ start:1320 stop:3821 length:2502 start_codon:yes stop_codon:yes gene_type:complete